MNMRPALRPMPPGLGPSRPPPHRGGGAAQKIGVFRLGEITVDIYD